MLTLVYTQFVASICLEVIFVDILLLLSGVHTVCCSNLLSVDKRKLKVGGKEKAEKAIEKLEEMKNEMVQEGDEKYSTLFDELVSKVEKVKLRSECVSEVD